MKLKYQMRGLGIGIIVTALLMGVVTDNRIPLSDAEIRMLALELGMVDSDSLKLSDIPNVAPGSSEEDEPSSTGADGASEPETEENGGDGSEEGGSASGPQGDSGGDSGDEGESGSAGDAVGGEGSPGNVGDAAGEEGQSGNVGDAAGEEGQFGNAEGFSEGTASDSPITVVIEGGATSYSVCLELQRLGLVEDAARFDNFLCDMGYSKSVREGTFQIPAGTSEEEIARIITGKR
ncbi:MAG: hypothetical protein HFH92_09070 [Lachnospiraceae bacterium]|uniref:hypothetical protein n=1 Tax=uncultured Acetatifactor sp. TaxID=1671927 RepID=UPI0026299EC5|nr:hypothetical protein [uncultured Acetatifactor sp.]MCI8789244.1 hypothetical protein [Lachnospiraceae bacterium]